MTARGWFWLLFAMFVVDVGLAVWLYDFGAGLLVVAGSIAAVFVLAVGAEGA